MPSRRSWSTSSCLLLSTMPSSTGIRCADHALLDHTNTFAATKYERMSCPSNTFAMSTCPISSNTTKSWRKS
jgi:hypothetical protein